MTAIVIEGRARWVIAGAAAMLFTTLLLFLFRVPIGTTSLPVVRQREETRSTVKVARPDETDRVLKEEAELRDLRPLFLPTERNAALPEPRLEPGRSFLDEPEGALTFSDADAHVSANLPPVALLKGQPLDAAHPIEALQDGVPMSLEGFGRHSVRTAPARPRGGFVEVTALRDGTKVLAEALPESARPRSDKPWAPLEFTAVVDAAGLATPLVVTEGSRVDEVDAHFRNYLAETYRIGERLSPGFYRITVAP